MTAPTFPARHLFITGKVQGVGYRAAFAREADRLLLKGWIRNRRDGRVEALVAGPAHALDAMLAWAHKGPPAAAVSQIEAVDQTVEDLAGFRLLHDE